MQGFDNFDISKWFDGVTFARVAESGSLPGVVKRAASSIRHVVGSATVVAGLTLAGHAAASEANASVPTASFSVGAGPSTGETAGLVQREQDVGPEYMPALLRSMESWESVPESAADLDVPNFF